MVHVCLMCCAGGVKFKILKCTWPYIERWTTLLIMHSRMQISFSPTSEVSFSSADFFYSQNELRWWSLLDWDGLWLPFVSSSHCIIYIVMSAIVNLTCLNQTRVLKKKQLEMFNYSRYHLGSLFYKLRLLVISPRSRIEEEIWFD
jgi:hypothetical protein